ncbi:MAG: transposase [bacterium]|nr:transposase [bacterium]
MGRSRFKFYEQHYPYFVTCSILDGISLFSDPELASIVLNSLEFLQTEASVLVNGFVLMENHMHMVIQSEHPGQTLKNFKSYTAKCMINSLEQRRRTLLLKKLRFHKKLHKRQSKYQVWEEGGYPKQIDSAKKMISCLDYIHYNPVKAGFVDTPEHWRYSSARNYNSMNGLITVSKYVG